MYVLYVCFTFVFSVDTGKSKLTWRNLVMDWFSGSKGHRSKIKVTGLESGRKTKSKESARFTF